MKLFLRSFTIALILLFTNSSYGQNTTTSIAHQYYQKADSLLTDEKFDSSLVYFKKALSIYQKSQAWERVASCYNKLSENQRNLVVYDQALFSSKKALEICNKHLSKNHMEKAHAFDGIGYYYENIESKLDKAIEHYNKSLSIKKEVLESTNHISIADSYLNLGIVCTKTGEFHKALDYLKTCRAIRISKLGEEHIEVAYVLKDLSGLYKKLGNYDLAVEYLTKCVEIAKKKYGENHLFIAHCHKSFGTFYYYKKNYEKALYHINKAITINKKASKDNTSVPASYYSTIANILNDLHQYDEALKYFKKTIEITKNTHGENHMLIMRTKYNISTVYYNRKEYNIALEQLKSTLVMAEKIYGKDHFELTRIYKAMGEIYIEKKEFSKAFDLLNKGLVICQKSLGEYHFRSETFQISLGNLLLAQRKYDKAISYYNKSLSINQKTYGDHSTHASRSYQRIGQCYLQQKKYHKALSYFGSAGKIIQTTKSNQKKNTDKSQREENSVFSLQLLNSKSKALIGIYKQTNNVKELDKSIATCQKGDSLIKYIRQSTSNHQDKITLAQLTEEVYEGAIVSQLLLYDTIKNRKSLEKAFFYAEKSKANVLKELLHDNNAKSFAGLSPKLLELEQELKIDHAFCQSRISKLQSSKTKDSLQISDYENKLFDISRRQDSITEILEKNHPKYYNLKHQNNVISVASIQERLNENATLLEFFTADSITYAFSISKNKLAVKELATPDLKNKVAKLQEAITSKNTASYKNTAHQMYQELIAPIADQLVGDQLIIVPDGSLWHLNFDLLLTQKDVSNNPAALSYLLKDYAITYANSANLFFDSYKSNPNTSKKRQECLAFSFSDSTNIIDAKTMSLATLRDSSDDLPGTRKEIKAIADIIEGQYFFGSEAVEANFKKNASRYNILHLALHGEVDNKRPENSKLFFTKTKDTIEDNYLYAHELFAMDIPAELTVLSACNTGAGKIAKGEGIMSLGNAFQYAGTKSLLLSGWEVSDQTTPELMKLFYTNLKAGMNKAKALQQAKLSYLHTADARHTAPFYWGGFYLVGDSSPMEFASTSYWFWIVGLGVLGMLLLGVFLYKKNYRSN